MRVLYTIAGFYRTAGMERVLAGKVAWLSAQGWEVVIVTTEQQGRPAAFEVPAAVRFIDLGIGYEDNNGAGFLSKTLGLPFKRIRHRRALKAVLRAERPDVAVSMFCGDEGFLPSLVRGLNADVSCCPGGAEVCMPAQSAAAPQLCRTVLECHFTRQKRVLYGRKGLLAVADRIRSRREPRIALRYDHFVVLTEEDRGYWLADCPSLERNIRVIPNPRTFAPEEIARLRTFAPEEIAALHETPQTPDMLPADSPTAGTQAADFLSADSQAASSAVVKGTVLPTVPKVVLAAGRYSHQKHPEALVEAWALIPPEEREGWTLRIAGDGELRPALEVLADRIAPAAGASVDAAPISSVGNPIAGPVTPATAAPAVILGPAADMRREYAAASVFALSSRYEGLPMVLLEAQAAGLPIVSFECKCGPRDVLTDGVDGFLVPEGDVEALADRLRRLINDPGLRAKMGRRALANSENYRVDAVMQRWMALFEAHPLGK